MDHRIVSPIEMYSVARNEINFYKTVLFYLCFQTSSALFLSEWKSQIENSLRLTIDAQPRLRLQVDLSRKPAYFIVLPPSVFDTLPIRTIERTDADEEFLDQIVEEECNRGFVYDQCSPLWRVVLIVSSGNGHFDLILTFNHAIADGMSGMGFFRTFVDYLSGKPTSSFSLNDDRPSYELISSKLPPISSFLFEIIEKLLLPNFLSRYFFPKTYWTGNLRLTGEESFQTRLVSFQLSSTTLNLLHQKCQLERTTIHTALLSSILLSITEIFGRENREFRCSTAVNIRRYCKPSISNEQMGVFLSGVDSSHYIPYRDNLIDLFWPLARQIKEQINDGIEHSALPLIQSLKFVSNWKEFLEKQRQTLPNGCQQSVDISNILRWSFESNDPSWQILHGGFTQSANIVGSAFTVSVVTVNDILKVYICFQEHSFDHLEQVKMMKDRMKQFLIEALTTSAICL